MKIFDKKDFGYALSLAASWAWGVSIIVGMQTVQTKGLVPFLIWAVANSLALPLFGVIAFRIKKLEQVINKKIVQVFTTAIMVFCLWIQMNSIYEEFMATGFLPENVSKIITILLSIAMAVYLYHDGLNRNIRVDKVLWILCYAVLLIMTVLGLVSKTETYPLQSYTGSDDLRWAWNTVPILFAGPIMNIQNWQMADKLRTEGRVEKAHILAGIFFGIYLGIVFILSRFQFSPVMNLVMVLAIMCIALTTMDAAVVGMQKIGGRKIGLALALVTVIAWPLVIPMGVLNLWTFMGNRRLEVAIVCIVAALIWQYVEKKKASSKDRSSQKEESVQ